MNTCPDCALELYEDAGKKICPGCGYVARKRNKMPARRECEMAKKTHMADLVNHGPLCFSLGMNFGYYWNWTHKWKEVTCKKCIKKKPAPKRR